MPSRFVLVVQRTQITSFLGVQDLAVLHHHILGMVIAMYHVMVHRDSLHHLMKLLPLASIQIVLEEVDPAYDHSPLVRHIIGFDLGGMDLLKKVYVKPYIFVQVLRLGRNKLGEGFCIQKLEHRAVAVANFGHIIWNGGRNTQDKSTPCQLPLPVYLGQCICVIVDLYNGVFIQPVDLSVAPRPITSHPSIESFR